MRTRRDQRLRDFLYLSVGLALTGLVLLAYALGLNGLERRSVDARFSIRATAAAPRDVVVVGIDPTTFADLNIRWPFPRSLHAKVIDRIAAGHPKAIAYDVQFSEYSAPAQDNALGAAIARHHGKVVLATTEVGQSGVPNLIFAPAALKAMGARAGDSNFKPDEGDVIRRVPYEVDHLESFALVAAATALGRPIKRSELGGSQGWIDYRGPAGTFTTYSFSDVLRGRVRPQSFTGKVVVVGATAPSLQDIHATSTSAAMSGAEVQANAIWTALHDFPLRSAPAWLDIFLIVALGMIAPLVSLRSPFVVSIGVSLVVGLVFVFGVQLAFDRGWIVAFVYPLTALALSTVAALVIHYFVAAFERERVRDVFSRFVPDTIVDEVLAQTGADLRLGGKTMSATVMFSDLRGFTSRSEHIPAEVLIEMLNKYLGEMSDGILDHGGTLVSYAGDGIYAVFGAPIAQDDHADRAFAAARHMLEVRLARFNEWLGQNGFGEPFRMGIGLNSGTVMCGNVGHIRRLEYTAVGDTVNTASRVEGRTKDAGCALLLAQATFDLLTAPPADLTYHGEVEIRGRVQTLKLWGLGFEPGGATAAGSTAVGG